ncbi:Serine/threonine-protein phosphatase bsl1 [Asimina triloba]
MKLSRQRSKYIAVMRLKAGQPDRVTDFCKRNKLQLIIRAHECVMDGFERFAQGQLITLFSATNYCGVAGTANNAGAILVVGRGLVVVPKLIHPLPPPIQSPESSPERVTDGTWMQELNIQRPPTPTRDKVELYASSPPIYYEQNVVCFDDLVVPAVNQINSLSSLSFMPWKAGRQKQLGKRRKKIGN